MPVPVTVYNKPQAHLVIKKTRNHASDINYARHSVFRHLTNSLPQPPSGPPPAFATRQEWINSLPSWRRNKPRRIWEEESHSSTESNLQGFEPGLAVAGDASVIKGARAQASNPPSSTAASREALAPISGMYHLLEEDTDDEMSPMDEWQLEDMCRLTDEDDDMGAEQDSDSGSLEYASDYQAVSYPADADVDGRQTFPPSYERGAFSPVLEDVSDNEPGSSPIGPTTPFADFVDRAVGGSHATLNHGRSAVDMRRQAPYCYGDGYCTNQCYQCQHCPVDQVVDQAAPVPESVVTPTASAAYRKLAEPLADWTVSFVWKVCTTGMSLPPQYAQPM